MANPNYEILDELEACSTIFGDILVDPAFVYFILEGPLEITGTIIAHDNSILKYVSLANVTKLGGFSFASPQITGQINFPEVTEIGTLEWRNISFTNGIDFYSWHAPKFVAVSNLNVEATDLSGFSPDYLNYDGSAFYYEGLEGLQTADNIRVVDNRRMDDVVFNSLKTISGSLTVGNNINTQRGTGKRDQGNLLVSLPVLESVGNVVIYDTTVHRALEGKVDLPVLGHVFGDLNITTVTGITELSVPALTDIDGGLNILDNTGLRDLSFPALRRVNHVVFEGGHSYAPGFSTISFPVLEEVASFYVNAPANSFDCSQLDHIRAIAGAFYCANDNGPYNPDTPPSSTPSSSTPPSSTPPSSTPPSSTGGPAPTSSSPGPSQTSEPYPTSESSSTPEPSPTSEPAATYETTTTSKPAATYETSTTSKPAATYETSATSEPVATDEPSSTSGPVTTDKPSQTGGPAPTGSSGSTGNPAGPAGTGTTPTSGTPASPSGSQPVTISGAYRLSLPFATIALLFMSWML